MIAVLVLVAAAVPIVDLSTRVAHAGGVTHGRTRQWGDALDVARHRPLAGYGADTYLAATGGGPRFAHNLFVDVPLELGVLGVFAVASVYVVVLRAAWRSRGTTAGTLLAPAVVAFLATNLVDWPWHQSAAGALFAIAVGATIGMARSHSP